MPTAPNDAAHSTLAKRHRRAGHALARMQRLGIEGRAVNTPSMRTVMELARGYSTRTIHRLAQLMEGSAGKMKVLNEKTGQVEEVEVVVPPAVQVRAGEILLERAYGKAPQALLVRDDDPEGGKANFLQLTIMERIAALRAAADENSRTVDLEAADHLEVVVSPAKSQTEIAEEMRVAPPIAERLRSMPPVDTSDFI